VAARRSVAPVAGLGPPTRGGSCSGS